MYSTITENMFLIKNFNTPCVEMYSVGNILHVHRYNKLFKKIFCQDFIPSKIKGLILHQLYPEFLIIENDIIEQLTFHLKENNPFHKIERKLYINQLQEWFKIVIIINDLDNIVVLLESFNNELNSEQTISFNETGICNSIFENMTSGFAFHEIICNKNGQPVDYKFIEVNPAFEYLTGLKREDILQKTVLEILPQTEPYWIERYGKVALQGVSYTFENYSKELQRYYDVTVYSPKKNYFATLFSDITYRKQIEKIAFESEQKYRRLIDNMGSSVVVYKITDDKSDFIFVDINKTAEKMDNISRDYIIGRKLTEEFPFVKDNELLNTFFKVYETGKPQNIIVNYQNIEGEDVWHDNYIYKLANGEIVAVYNDITLQRKAEQALQISESRFKNAIEATNDAIWEVDLVKNTFYVSPRFYTMLGYEVNEFEPKIENVLNIFHPGDFEKTKQLFDSIKFDQTATVEYRLKDKYGNWHWLLTRFKFSEHDEQGNITHIVGVNIDNHARKIAEDSLSESLKRLQILSNLPFEGIFIHAEGEVLDLTQSFCKIFNQSKLDILSKKFFDITIPQEYHAQFFTHVQQNNPNEIIQIEGFRKDGTRFPIEIQSREIFYKGAKATMTAVRDVTDRIEALNQLKESEKRFRDIFTISQDAILISKLDSTFITANPSFFAQLKFTPDELKDMKIINLVNPEYLNQAIKALSTIKTDRTISGLEIEFIDKDNNIMPLEVSATLIEYENNECILSHFRNISERRLFEKRVFEAMVEAEEKERKRLAEDLHEEMGPFLSAIKLYAEELTRYSTTTEGLEIIALLQTMANEAVSKARTISNDLMPNVLSDFGLAGAIRSFISKINKTKKTTFVLTYDNSIGNIDKKIEIALYRIILELINNTIKHAKAEQAEIEIYQENEILFVRYADNGLGFDFEKMLNKEKGLGLRNIISRLKMMQGKYTFVSPESDKGVEYKLSIPLN